MVRTRNQDNYDAARTSLLEIGEKLFRQQSFAETGINEVLKQAGIAKGSFYHYFENKQAFGLAVARRYSENQVEFARSFLTDNQQPKLERLKAFFLAAKADMAQRDYGQGCLMCNLTTELADEYPAFQSELKQNWAQLSAEIKHCLDSEVLTAVGLSHLSPGEAADWLLNAWSGALTRMKATADSKPLNLFIKSIFDRKE